MATYTLMLGTVVVLMHMANKGFWMMIKNSGSFENIFLHYLLCFYAIITMTITVGLVITYGGLVYFLMCTKWRGFKI